MTNKQQDATDLSLFIQLGGEVVDKWDRKRIVATLTKEARITIAVAEEIAIVVEAQIKQVGVTRVSTSLVRELVDAELFKRGLEDARSRHARLGLPLYDVEQIVMSRNKENANIPHNPEATNLSLAENIKKQYALERVFTSDVSRAHVRGDIHLHDLGFIDRPYCSGQNLDYIKKFGLSLPNAHSIARPAKHPDVLLAHMIKFSAALQGHFAGAIGWDAVNLFFAPFLVGMPFSEAKQLAQMIIYEYSQQAVARGGQAIFSDMNIYWEVPKHFVGTPAIGPGGTFTGKTYNEYLPESQMLAKALFEVYLGGDGIGRPFFWPKPEVHITEKFFQTPGHEEFLRLISEVAATRGNTYFVFDRGETARISECCRLAFKLENSDLDDAKTPWKMRYSAIQNVTVNLPRIALKAKGSTADLYRQIDVVLRLVARAHLQKKKFIERLLALKDQGPLSLLAMDLDGEIYLRMHRVTYLVGILGLNEMVQAHTGEQLHQSEEAFKFGLKIIAYMNLKCKEFSKELGIRMVLEQTPAESTAYRMAKLDVETYGDVARAIVKGDLDSNSIYYTNSTYLNVSEPINPIERIKSEGKFHDLIEAGALSHVWIADSHPKPEAIASFVTNTFRLTRNAQIAFSPEFTFCSCGRVFRGLLNKCSVCGSLKAEGISVIK